MAKERKEARQGPKRNVKRRQRTVSVFRQLPTGEEIFAYSTGLTYAKASMDSVQDANGLILEFGEHLRYERIYCYGL
jgi:hypothetical protein